MLPYRTTKWSNQIWNLLKISGWEREINMEWPYHDQSVSCQPGGSSASSKLLAWSYILVRTCQSQKHVTQVQIHVRGVTIHRGMGYPQRKPSISCTLLYQDWILPHVYFILWTQHMYHGQLIIQGLAQAHPNYERLVMGVALMMVLVILALI